MFTISVAIPLTLTVVDEAELTSLTAKIIDIEEDVEGDITIRLDFHDHTEFYYDEFKLISYLNPYLENSVFYEEVNVGDTITILTDSYNGPCMYYNIYTIEKDGVEYLSVQEANEGYEDNYVPRSEADVKIIAVSSSIAIVFGIGALVLYITKNKYQ